MIMLENSFARSTFDISRADGGEVAGGQVGHVFEEVEIAQHVVDAVDGVVDGVDVDVVDAGGSGHGALAGVLSALKVDALICGGGYSDRQSGQLCERQQLCS